MTTLRHLHLQKIDNKIVHLAVPTATMRNRIFNKYWPILLAALAEIGIPDAQVDIEVRDDLPQPADENKASQTDLDESFAAAAEQERRQQRDANLQTDATTPANSDATTATGSISQYSNGHTKQPINDLYTFENFVIGSNNRFAAAAALSVAEAPGTAYNPLFIYGNAGLGKTHLMKSIVRYIQKHHTDIKARYVTTETFLNDFVEGIATRNKKFKNDYRAVDVLLLDDIQIMEGKEAFQEELFHTFNDLHSNECQIVISSDRAPRNLTTLSERMRSRFEWGLIIDIQPPDLETRMAILRLKSKDKKVSLAVQQLIAEKITNNIRELEGALTRISAYTELTKAEVSVETARELLSEMIAKEASRITPQLIIKTTVTRLGYSEKQLSSPDRQQSLVRARHTCMYVIRELTDLSYPAIAEYFGSRDHTSVMHGVKKISSEMHENEEVYNQVTSLINKIKAA